MRLVIAVLSVLCLLALATDASAQCGRSVTTQSVQTAQPQVSVFQLPAQQPITASQSATIGGQSFAPAAVVPQGTCTTGQCNLSQQTFAPASQATVLQTTTTRNGRGLGLLDSIRAARTQRVLARAQGVRPQTIRQRTIVRG